jgi:hypothetical protein
MGESNRGHEKGGRLHTTQERGGGVRLAFLHLASSHTWLNAYVRA